MVDSMRRSSQPRSNPGTVTRTARRRLAPLVLVLGILAWPAVERPRAQELPPKDVAPSQKTGPGSAKSEPTPRDMPVPPAPQPRAIRGVVEFTSSVVATPRSFHFTIAPNTPLKDLLPVPPPVQKTVGPMIPEDLAQVPEVQFQAPLAKDLASNEAMKQIAHQIAKINYLNGKKADGFLEALRGQRLDLAGLPFAMGDACRTKGERSRQFARAVATVRRALQSQTGRVVMIEQTGRVVMIEQAAVRPPVATAIGEKTRQRVQPAPAAPAQAVPPTREVVVQKPQPSAPVAQAAPRAASVPLPPPAPPVRVAEDRTPAESFWEQYQAACAQEDKALARIDRAQREHITVARIAALMQVLAPEAPSLRLGLVNYLAAVSHVEATRALARLVLFSAEDEVRQAALEALKVRRERDYTAILLRGLRYPWPAVARRAAEALVQLERTDLVPQLVALLDEPDPRAPVVQEINHRRVPVVRELVRLNHHRSCLLCHAPGNTGQVAPETLTAAVPVPSQPLPSPADGYLISSPDLLVRIDVTYLRQDFSLYQPVPDANPWPEMQRFDFVSRRRVLTEEEAAAYREKLAREEPSRPSPYQRAALAALRELTGRDAEPTAEGWRRLLGLPAQQRRTASPQDG